MPDSRTHRSAAPEDPELFAPGMVGVLREAVGHLSWLLSRGYAWKSSLKLVGDRFGLAERQRRALLRCAASERDCADRAARRLERAQLAGRSLAVDGFNVLTTVEAALGGAVVLIGRDGCARDILGLAGTWRRVAETAPALEHTVAFLVDSGLEHVDWFLDAPVSNSGRLRALLTDACRRGGLGGTAAVVPDADAALLAQEDPVASADRRVIDGAVAWFDLARELIAERAPAAWIVDLSDGAAD